MLQKCIYMKWLFQLNDLHFFNAAALSPKQPPRPEMMTYFAVTSLSRTHQVTLLPKICHQMCPGPPLQAVIGCILEVVYTRI